ncbi:hypothetical protein Taro_016703 [Colocasia esculenta]|uniref:Uncharacterized protein n=1 Tax=Colocasia esculenta TaxID=4460 RepID=A0A843UL19_COLES|nr:hypothetical protein [Colocasia esculenta]
MARIGTPTHGATRKRQYEGSNQLNPKTTQGKMTTLEGLNDAHPGNTTPQWSIATPSNQRKESTQGTGKQNEPSKPQGHTKSHRHNQETWKRLTRQAGQRNGQTHVQAHNTLTDNAQADCNIDSLTGNEDSSSPPRESSDDQTKHKAAFGRTSAKKSQEPSWENLTRMQPNRTTNFKPQGQHNAQHDRNEHGAVLRETLTRTTTNGFGKPHQNTGQPSDAPQPRGQRNSNQKQAQHSFGETSLPPEPIEKNSGSTSPELTTSQRQADNNHKHVS